MELKKNIDENLKKFLRPFYTRNFGQYVGVRDKFIKIQPNDKMHYPKILQIFLGSACHSSDTFLKKFFLEPTLIKECYVPFVQNIKFDSGYQTKLQGCENLVTMKCKFCHSSTFAVDLKPTKDSHSTREEIKRGGRITKKE